MLSMLSRTAICGAVSEKRDALAKAERRKKEEQVNVLTCVPNVSHFPLHLHASVCGCVYVCDCFPLISSFSLLRLKLREAVSNVSVKQELAKCTFRPTLIAKYKGDGRRENSLPDGSSRRKIWLEEQLSKVHSAATSDQFFLSSWVRMQAILPSNEPLCDSDATCFVGCSFLSLCIAVCVTLFAGKS